MSLRRLDNLTNNVSNMIMYVPSPSLAYFIKGMLKDIFKVDKDFVVTVDTAKALQSAKLDSYVAPLLCDKWLIHVNAEKLTKKDLLTGLSNNPVHGITVYWTSSYKVYRTLIDSDIVKKQSVHYPNFSYSKLGYSDIILLHTLMVGKKKGLNEELLTYVAKNYNYDVQSVCDLFTMIRSGTEVTTKREIIENIGVGGNSISSLAIKILTASPKTEKGRARAMSDAIKLMEDLSVTYNYNTIRKFMINNIEGFMDIKQLQIMGIYGRINKEVPDTFDSKRLSMLKRFEKVVLNDITMPKLLNLKICLSQYNSFNADIALTQAFSEYYNSLVLSKD